MAKTKKIPLIEDFNNIPAESLVPEEEQPYPLPAHWKWVRLGQVTEVVSGGTPKTTVPEYWDNGEIPWLTPADLSGYSERYISRGFKNITLKGVAHSSATLFPKGTVCLSTRAPIGYVAIAENEMSTNQGFKSFIPGPLVMSEYLAIYLKGSKSLLESMASGTTFLELSKSKAGLIPFPLAPLEEQKQIVAYLDDKLGKIDSVRGKLQDFLDHAAQRKDNLIQAGVTGHLTSHWREEHNAHLNDWQLKQISDLGEVVTGSTPSTKNPEYYGGQIPFVKPADLDAGRYIKSAQSFLSQAGAKVSRMLPAKTVAVCCIGSLGKCGLIEVPAATNQQINSIIPRSGTHAVYLYYLCSSPKFKAAMIEKSSSTTLSILNKSRFSKLEFSIPTMGEQEEIARILDEQLECIERTDKLVAEVLERLDTMKQQIVSAALAGRLSLQVP